MKSTKAFSLIAAAALAGMAQAAQGAAGPPRVVGTYYEDYLVVSGSVSSNSQSPYQVFLGFSKLPTLSTPYNLTLTEISCRFLTSGGSIKQMWLSMTDNGVNDRRRHHIDAPLPEGFSSFRAPINYLILGGPPTQPYFNAFFQSPNSGQVSYDLDCTIVGTITPK